MAGFTNAEEQAVLDWFLATRVANPVVCLSTTTPTEAGGNFTEPVGNNYAPVAMPNANWGAAAAGDPSTKANTSACVFPQATGAWGTITHWGIKDGVGGTLKYWAPLDATKAPTALDIPSFAIGQLILKLGDPGDTY